MNISLLTQKAARLAEGVLSLALLMTPIPAVATQGDLSIAHVEITQGLQNGANTVPLVAGKRTMVRVFMELQDASSVSSVSARLLAQRRTDGKIEELEGSPLEPAKLGVVFGKDFSGRLSKNEILFDLPLQWIAQAGEIDLSLELVPPSHFKDTNSANNRFPMADEAPLVMELHAVPPVRIGFLRVDFCHPVRRCFQPDQRVGTREAAAWLRAVFPIAPENLIYYPFGFEPFRWPSKPEEPERQLLLERLETLLEKKALAADTSVFLYAWLPTNAGLGWGWSNLRHAAFGGGPGTDSCSSHWRRTLAHEIAHCVLRDGRQSRRRMDDLYVGELGFDAEGVDPFRRRVMLTAPDCEGCGCCKTCGERLHDVMVEKKLEKDAWITETTYRRLFEHLRRPRRELENKEASPCAVEQEGGGTSGDLLVLRGWVTPDGGGFFPFLPQSPTEGARRAAREAPPGGPYEVRLIARDQKICETLAWTPAFVGAEMPERETETFVFLVPRYRDLERIELRIPSEDKTLAEVVRPPHAPGVQKPRIQDVTYEPPPDTEAPSWQDGDEERPRGILRWQSNLNQLPETRGPVAQHVFYSRDGETWDLVAADLAAATSEIGLDLTGLPACESCRLKVVAAYGFDMAEEVTQPFPQANQPPLALIVIPVAQEVTITAGEPLRLVGAGYDAESSDELGELPPESLTWSVVETTQTWTGSPVEIVLEPGSYTIHLVATDSGGAKSPPAVVTVVVGEREAEP